MVADNKQSRKLNEERSRDLTFFSFKNSGGENRRIIESDAQRSRRSRASWLLKHRWIGIPERRAWVCHPKAVPLYQSSDPTCFGCRAQIAFHDLPNPDRYRIVRKNYRHDFNFELLESLGVRLDLLHEELKLKARRNQ